MALHTSHSLVGTLYRNMRLLRHTNSIANSMTQKSCPYRFWFDVEPQVASIETGNVAFWLLAGVSAVDGNIVVLIEVELRLSGIVEKIVAEVAIAVVEVDSENIFVTTDTGSIESEDV
jgi:hypothetical protein